MGEVEFYLVQRKEIQLKAQINNLPPDGNIVLRAFYIGSDYTYAYSEKFRENIFRDNTLDEQLLIGVRVRAVQQPNN